MANDKGSGKSGGKVNKSDAIREALGANPDSNPKEIVALLGERGIKVAPTLVYYIRSKSRQAGRKAKRARVAAPQRPVLVAGEAEAAPTPRARGPRTPRARARHLLQLRPDPTSSNDSDHRYKHTESAGSCGALFLLAASLANVACRRTDACADGRRDATR